MARKLKGIRRKGKGWQTYIRINGELYTKCWPLATPVSEMRDWLDDQVEKYGGERDAEGGLAARVAEYLKRKAAMPTIKQHTAHLALWVHELGRDRPPISVTSVEIDIILQGWLETLEPGTVRKRRSALRSFYATMYPTKVSPVKGSANPKSPKPEAREIAYPRIEAALAAMPTYRDTKKGLPQRMNKAKIRARCIAYSGIPPGLLGQILPHDLSLVAGTVRIGARSKGEGVEARTLQLTADGLAAFRDFHAHGCYGPFAIESCNRAFKRGCKRAGIDPKSVRLYDLRHSFLSQVYRITRDLATVGRLGLHAEGSACTARYAKGANAEVDAAAVAAFSSALQLQRQQLLKPAAKTGSSAAKLHQGNATSKAASRRRATGLRAVQVSGGKLPRKVARSRKAS